MGMDMLAVSMRPDHHLVIRQILFREFLRNFQRQFRRDLSWLVGYDDVIRLPPVQLAQFPLGIHHLLIGITGVTVEVCGQYLILGLAPV